MDPHIAALMRATRKKHCQPIEHAKMPPLHFLLNGKRWTENDAPPTMTVLDFLRECARLTGTKEGCAEGDCGACTIVLGRLREGDLHYQAVNSCLMMLPQIDHCAVLTVEGLAAPSGELHPVQRAMVDTDATQCGFCTPGFVMAMFAFHHGGEPAQEAIIHEALAGNLCRCTGYRSIVEACRRVAAGPDDRFMAQKPLTRDALAARAVRCAGAVPRCAPACRRYRSGIARQQGSRVYSCGHCRRGCTGAPRNPDLGRRARARRRGDLYRGACLPASVFSVILRARAAHRLAADPQSRNRRGQSRDRISHRRYPPLPDCARRGRDTRFKQRRAEYAGRIFHHRISSDRPFAG